MLFNGHLKSQLKIRFSYENTFDVSKAEQHGQDHTEAGGAIDEHSCKDSPRYVQRCIINLLGHLKAISQEQAH